MGTKTSVKSIRYNVSYADLSPIGARWLSPTVSSQNRWCLRSPGWSRMVDTLSAADRSERMRRVKGKNTRPEMVVRRLVHSMGFRYRLHRPDLPGKPDLVFASRRAVIFVHGCFWHRHPDPNCRLARIPKSRLEFWMPKLTANRDRDMRHKQALIASGWRVLDIWECEATNREQITAKIAAFLGGVTV